MGLKLVDQILIGSVLSDLPYFYGISTYSTILNATIYFICKSFILFYHFFVLDQKVWFYDISTTSADLLQKMVLALNNPQMFICH